MRDHIPLLYSKNGEKKTPVPSQNRRFADGQRPSAGHPTDAADRLDDPFVIARKAIAEIRALSGPLPGAEPIAGARRQEIGFGASGKENHRRIWRSFKRLESAADRWPAESTHGFQV